MSTLYPSLEDMKVHHILTAQDDAVGPQPRAPAVAPSAREMPEPPQSDGNLLQTPPHLLSHPRNPPSSIGIQTFITKSPLYFRWMLPPEAASAPVFYPNLADLNDYMGLSLSSQEIQMNLDLIPTGHSAVCPSSSAQGPLVAPVTGSDAGIRRAEIKPGLREIQLCKDERGKTGLRLRTIDKGLFVQLVKANSPAALVGLRFGDQILQIDGKNCAGWNMDKAKRVLKKASPEKIVLVVRDRPFQRTLTMHKDGSGHVGFVIKKGQITSVARDSSAARNGLLIHHYICEVNGQNVIGLKDKEITEILANADKIITLTIVPAVIYEHMIKKLSSGLVKSSMDHSVPDM